MDCTKYYIARKQSELEEVNAEITETAEIIASRAKELAANPGQGCEINYIASLSAMLSTLQGKREVLKDILRMLNEIDKHSQTEC